MRILFFQAYAQELSTSEQEIANENNEKQTAYINVWNEMQSMGVTENVYTSLTTDVYLDFGFILTTK